MTIKETNQIPATIEMMITKASPLQWRRRHRCTAVTEHMLFWSVVAKFCGARDAHIASTAVGHAVSADEHHSEAPSSFNNRAVTLHCCASVVKRNA